MIPPTFRFSISAWGRASFSKIYDLHQREASSEQESWTAGSKPLPHGLLAEVVDNGYADHDLQALARNE